ncbi:MAG: glucuronyl hydrolase, partial [Phycisphaerales bacterium]|nr:glucuronyl hydrolase [Phycisphaerales bacterium]
LLARTRHDIAGLHGAWRELRTRRDHLVNPHGIHLRWHMQGHHSFTNWCRGIAWYLLGFSRSFDAVGVELAPADLRDEFVRAAEWIRGYQNEAGLWHAFVDDPRCGPDTAGSAGIAAAMLQGVKLGLLPMAYRDCAQRAVNSLLEHLTPDGLLSGITQSNRGGEALQRSNYRVISPMGMGMLAQAVAHLMSLQSTA